jgi:hypothetical protein
LAQNEWFPPCYSRCEKFGPQLTPSSQSEIAVASLNSSSEIQTRIKNGRIFWTGPLLLLAAPTVLLLLCQSITAIILFAINRHAPWRQSGDWWQVYGTAVDVGCLAGLRYYARREGMGFRDLIGKVQLSRGHDFLLGLGYFLITFPLFLLGGHFAQKLLYGASPQDLSANFVRTHQLPMWALVFSLTIWWFVWSPTEEMTYQAYVLPRLHKLSGRPLMSFLIVAFCWTLQHCALPFVPSWRYVTFRFLAFLPGVCVMMLCYLRTRRLTPLIFAHWPMDLAGALLLAIS